MMLQDFFLFSLCALASWRDYNLVHNKCLPWRANDNTILLRMKKIVVPALCSVFVLYACTKGINPYYGVLYATVNNNRDTFNTNVLGIRDSATGTYRLSIVGFQGAFGDSTKGGFESAQLGFEIVSAKPITTGTYITDSTAGTTLTLLYTPAKLARYDSLLTSNPNQPTVTITKLTSGNMQGSFSGAAFYRDSTAIIKATITNGHFDVDLQ